MATRVAAVLPMRGRSGVRPGTRRLVLGRLMERLMLIVARSAMARCVVGIGRILLATTDNGRRLHQLSTLLMFVQHMSWFEPQVPSLRRRRRRLPADLLLHPCRHPLQMPPLLRNRQPSFVLYVTVLVLRMQRMSWTV